MVRWFLAALLLSIAVCAFVDFRAKQKYAATQHDIAARQTELQKLSDLDQQVLAYQKKKDALQKRIDIVDRLYKASQRSAK